MDLTSRLSLPPDEQSPPVNYATTTHKLQNLFTPSPPTLKRRASSTLQQQPNKKRQFTELNSTYVPPSQQLVPLVSRAEGAAAVQLQNELSSTAEAVEDSDSDDDVFEDAPEDPSDQQDTISGDVMPTIENNTTGVSAQEELRTIDELFHTANTGRFSRFDSPNLGTMHVNDDSEMVESNEPNFRSVSGEQGPEKTSKYQDLHHLDIVKEKIEGVNAIDPPEDTNEESEVEDLHAKYFGKKSSDPKDDDSIIELSDDENTDKPTRRFSTPPLPEVKKAPSTTDAPTRRKRDPKYLPRLRDGPDVNLDISPHLLAHSRFHFRVSDLIPRIQNLPSNLSFDHQRRYWIAVLLRHKKPKNATSEKDFVWMKGNRNSSVKTVWMTFLNTLFMEEEEACLMLGRERVEMQARMEELDYWGDKLIVMRVVRKRDERGRGNEECEGCGLVEGVERWAMWGSRDAVREVIELDDD